MTRSGHAFHRHAEAVVSFELHRARRRLNPLPAAERTAVEGVTATIAAAVVDGVLEQARHDPLLAASLASIYGGSDPGTVLCIAD
jgi:hypothetical protein